MTLVQTFSFFSARRFTGLYIASIMSAALFTIPAMAAEPVNSSFNQCLSTLTDQAISQGITQSTLDKTLRVAKQRQKVVQLDRNQPEFLATFADYYNKRVNDWRISKGQAKFAEHADFLGELTAQYGIPGQYLMAFWGLETNYGNYKGKIPTIDALATLACEPRRKTFFTQETINGTIHHSRASSRCALNARVVGRGNGSHPVYAIDLCSVCNRWRWQWYD